MTKSRLALILVRPSLLSFTISMLLALTILLLANWQRLTQNPLLQDSFFGPAGLVTVLQDAPDGLSGLWQVVVGGTQVYNVIVVIVAVIVGITVYGLLEGFDRLAAGISDVWRNMRTHDRDLQAEVGVRTGVRVLSLVLWIVYSILFAKVVLPFSILAFGTGVSEPFTLSGVEYNLIGLAVLFLGLHVNVLLLRFLTLRVRLFGTRPELYT